MSISHNGETYALLFKKIEVPEGIRFLTESKDEFQVGAMERPKGYIVPPHSHPRGERVMQGFSEFLYIEKGSIKVAVFDDEWDELKTEVLNPGDFLLFMRGGHSIEVLEDCRMIEVKQGPYVDEFTKKSFRPTA